VKLAAFLSKIAATSLPPGGILQWQGGDADTAEAHELPRRTMNAHSPENRSVLPESAKYNLCAHASLPNMVWPSNRRPG